MFANKKMYLFISFVILLILACGQLEFGLEANQEEPSPVPPTKTAATGSLSDGAKQTKEKNPAPTQTDTIEPLPSTEEGRLECSQFGIDDLVSIACNIQDSFISRNISPLLSYMPPEFAIGYWLSEWTTVTPEYALDSFQQYWLPPNPEQMTFTTDPERFPDIGRPIETMLGPDDEVALVIYSEGWNEDGKGAVIIFITGNETAGYQFRAILVSGNHFEMPPGPEDAN